MQHAVPAAMERSIFLFHTWIATVTARDSTSGTPWFPEKKWMSFSEYTTRRANTAEGRIKKAEPHGMHINPIRKRYEPESCENRNRVRKRFLKNLPCPTFPFLLQSYPLFRHKQYTYTISFHFIFQCMGRRHIKDHSRAYSETLPPGEIKKLRAAVDHSLSGRWQPADPISDFWFLFSVSYFLISVLWFLISVLWCLFSVFLSHTPLGKNKKQHIS